MSPLCYHRYGRWENNKCVCAVCGKSLPYKYNEKFNGVFPIEKLLEKVTPFDVVISTTTVDRNWFDAHRVDDGYIL